MNIPKLVAYSPNEKTVDNIHEVQKKYPHAVSNAQDAITLSLALVANEIVFEPNESERNALNTLLDRVGGLQGDVTRAPGWLLEEWRIIHEAGLGRREMTGRMLLLIERIAEKLGVSDDVAE